MKRFEIHSHSAKGSNIRLIDSINSPKGLLQTAYDKGYSGLTITDHEFVGNSVMMLMAEKELKEKKLISEDFKVALGNEIYLVDTRNKKEIKKYFHFILIAKNSLGHEALRKLSSIAWYNNFFDRNQCRVPTLKSELEAIVHEYPNTLIATTACIGNELFFMMNKQDYEGIEKYINFCKNLFKDDFYLEIAPAATPEQETYNKFVSELSKKYSIPVVIGCDAHYLRKEDRFIHKSFLNSKEGEREVDDFYGYTYLMSNEEVEENIPYFSKDFLEECYRNSESIRQKITNYDVFKKQIIPKENVKVYEKNNFDSIKKEKYPVLRNFLDGDDIQDRYWANEVLTALDEKNIENKETYLDRLEIEADVLNTISEKIDDHLTAYHNTIKQFIDLFWESGSIVGPGRGSATGFLSNYLLGITQLDPIVWKLNYWRYLNKERVELPDIDVDLSPSKRALILKKIRERRGSDIKVLQVATFGSEKPKSAILTACRGYRKQDEKGNELYPDGINVDDAQYMSSLIPQTRGFLWSLNDCFYGNPDEGREPVNALIDEVAKYDGLKEIIFAIEGIITRRGEHASGVILYNDDPWKTNAVMRAPNGDLITQFDLHESEMLGDTKFDFLLTDVSDRLRITLELLQEYGFIDSNLSLREAYNKYIHPDVLELDNEKIWDSLANGSVINIFQFNDGVGRDAAKLIKPRDPNEMTISNALMRLMAEKGEERPLDKYYRFRANSEIWENEMNEYNLTNEQRKVVSRYYESCSGVPAYQETLMEILMDKDISNFSLTDANSARKIVAKKKMSEIPKLKEKFFNSCKERNLAEYVWHTAIQPQLGYSFSVE